MKHLFTLMFSIVFIRYGVSQELYFSKNYSHLHDDFHIDSVFNLKNLYEHENATNYPTVRPFITDDSRVVGHRLAQLETWFRGDHEGGQQWLMFAYGPAKWAEISLGGVVGYENIGNNKIRLSYALPLIQGKFLFREYQPNKAPGVGLVLGTFFPLGQGAFRPPGYGTFSFATVSQCFGKGEKLLLHLNLGANYLHIDGHNKFLGTWGFGSQVKIYKGFHLVGEIFSGDPYVPGTGLAYQLGFRHFFSDLIQIDMTAGDGVSGVKQLPFWFSAGVRLVTERFLKKKENKKSGYQSFSDKSHMMTLLLKP